MSVGPFKKTWQHSVIHEAYIATHECDKTGTVTNEAIYQYFQYGRSRHMNIQRQKNPALYDHSLPAADDLYQLQKLYFLSIWFNVLFFPLKTHIISLVDLD